MTELVPPQSKESEMLVLGCMLTQQSSLNIAADVLSGGYPPIWRAQDDLCGFEGHVQLKDKAADVHLTCDETMPHRCRVTRR